jgi:signal transduction histidine kinase
VSALLSTLQRLPDDARAELERALLPVARDAALGALTADLAHDVGNALFGLVGLVELSLDGTPIDADRAQLITNAQADVKDAFRPLLAFARGDDEHDGDLADAAREALALYRHGARKHRDLVERLPAHAPVACPRALLVQAVVHVLLATDDAATPLTVEVDGTSLRAAPAGADSLHSVAAARIAADHGGALERDGDSLRLRFS